MLLITPRLVRTLARPEAGFMEFAAGTDATSGAAQPGLPVVPTFTPPPVPPPAAPETPTPPPGGLTMPGAPGPSAPPGQPMVPFGGIQPPPTPPTQ